MKCSAGTARQVVPDAVARKTAALSRSFRIRPVNGLLQSPFSEHVFEYRLPSQQMFLADPLQNLRRTRVIPGALGVNDRDRPLGADVEAVGLRKGVIKGSVLNGA